ncbi:MAG: hypothetical protein H0V29_08300 [Thermoleophilaceae bacterium]|nr:hypothetical protein [Thermoleophilaceae bacterium]
MAIGVLVGDVTLEGLRTDKAGGQVQCRYVGRSESCRVNVTLKLGKKKVADVDVDAKKPDSNIDGPIGNFKFGMSKAGRAALKGEKSAKVTISGSYELGGAAPQKLPTKTYTVSGAKKFWVISNDKGLNGKDGKPPSDE